MTEEAKAARRAYLKQYREKNRDRINEYHKQWRDNNPDKVKAAAARYWERKAQKYNQSEDPKVKRTPRN